MAVNLIRSHRIVYFCKNLIMLRIGQGIDFHQIGTGREFWLGGVLIEFELGCIGHSDADVLLHAICDALLGALALGDIGIHFPNNNPDFKNIDSKILLARTYDKIKETGYRVVNIDSTICLEEPKIMKYIPAMQKIIAGSLEIKTGDISIKATTTETMGAIGRKEGIMAQAVVLLEK
jgi:2-C-methyl-D-erythritol 2,4-cyclodiphosphate synthase